MYSGLELSFGNRWRYFLHFFHRISIRLYFSFIEYQFVFIIDDFFTIYIQSYNWNYRLYSMALFFTFLLLESGP